MLYTKLKAIQRGHIEDPFNWCMKVRSPEQYMTEDENAIVAGVVEVLSKISESKVGATTDVQISVAEVVAPVQS